MKIAVIGSGYVGLVTGVCFANLGNDVICVDNNEQKIRSLKKGKVPFYEPGLGELVRVNIKERRLRFSSDTRNAVRASDIIFISVNTPRRENGEANLIFVEAVSREIALCMNKYKLIIEKSTVPVDTGEKIYQTVKRNLKKKIDFDVASNPEFLREGSALYDFMNPDRIVIGVRSKRAEKILRDLYRPLKATLVVTDVKSSELIKHASNSFLAMKISFINAVSQVCQKVGADIGMVAKGMGYDKRIGDRFLEAGVGFGGSCFPKDLFAFMRISESLGVNYELLRDTLEINENQKRLFLKMMEDTLWNLYSKTIAVLGLAFKADTDDMRSAPSIDIINHLKGAGVKVRAFDPQAISTAKKVLKGITYAKSSYEACRGADALVILTDWDEFKKLDLKRVKKLLKQPVIFDGRNLYDPSQMKKLGFQYYSIGRPSVS
jgi:UDPglucose 6-dehydrogenase